jgi:hypothetical protein
MGKNPGERYTLWSSKTGRTIGRVVEILRETEARIEAFRPSVNAAIDLVYEGQRAPEERRSGRAEFRGAFWRDFPNGERRLAVYSFGWSDATGTRTQSWSHENYEGPEDRDLLRRVRGTEKPLDPIEQLLWASEWETVVGMALGPKVEVLSAALCRERELWCRRAVVMTALSNALGREESPFRYSGNHRATRYTIGSELFVRTASGLYHGDPDVHVKVDPQTNIYPQEYLRMSSYDLRDRARRRNNKEK